MHISVDNYCWGGVKSFERRHIMITVDSTIQILRLVKKIVMQEINDNNTNHAIIYNNSSKSCV